MPNFISEDQIEKAAVALLHDQYGYRTLNCRKAGSGRRNDQAAGRGDGRRRPLFLRRFAGA